MDLKKYIRSIPDYPKKGILFRDITTLIKNPEAFNYTVDRIVEISKKIKYAISGGVTGKWAQPIEIKNPVLYNYIDKNFQKINQIGNRKILLKKDKS